jgi:hypothetical protein
MMAIVPTYEESARAILSFLKLKDVHPNEMVIASQVNQQFCLCGGYQVCHRARLARTAYKRQIPADGNWVH